MNLYPHQIEAVEFHYKLKYSICGDAPGLGKTLIALKMIQQSKLKSLVVVPAYLKGNWEREINTFCPDVLTHAEIITYNLFTKLVEQKVTNLNSYKFFVFDEAHYLKAPESKRTKAAHDVISIKKPDRLLLLTGTAVLNRVTEFWSLLKLVSYGRNYPQFATYDKFHTFARTFSYLDQYEIRGRKFLKYYGIKNQEVLKNLIRPIYLRRKTEEVINLPEQIFSYIGDTEKRDIELERAWEMYEGSDNKSHFSTQKAVNALSKVNYTCEFILDTLSDRKVIVFSDHLQAAKEIYEKLSEYLPCALITGETSNDDRLKAMLALKDNINVIVATIGAASTGLNLQAANYMVFNDVCWVPGVLEQAMKRIHRIGTKKTCFYYFVTSSKIDYLIQKTINEKRLVIEQAT